MWSMGPIRDLSSAFAEVCTQGSHGPDEPPAELDTQARKAGVVQVAGIGSRNDASVLFIRDGWPPGVSGESGVSVELHEVRRVAGERVRGGGFSDSDLRMGRRPVRKNVGPDCGGGGYRRTKG